MKEEFVSYEQAVKLKELGFDWECDHHYDFVIDSKPILQSTKRNSDLMEHCINVPTLSLAQKWLREVKGIDVLVFNCACGYGWEISKSDSRSRGTTIALFDDKGEDESSGMWLSYESALSAGIDAALKILEEVQ